MALERLESFPFDSKFDGYSDDGYPVYDRAVGASMLRETFKQFFSDGVFGTPADAWQITKGDGLSVKVAPGTAIIRGGIASTTDAVTLKLADSAPQGRVAYSIFLRVDDNDEYRSLYLRVSEGEASSTPAPTNPDNDAAVKELRLGYVVVPSGATDLTDAEVVNEKGLSVCPYAAPFDNIDLSAFFADLQTKGDEVFQSFMTFLDSNIELVQSAIDGTTAGKLQNEINQLKITLPNTTFWDYISGDTSSDQGDKHVTVENIRYFRQKNKVEFLDDDAFDEQMALPVVTKPDYAVSVSNAHKLYERVLGVGQKELKDYTWTELKAISALVTNQTKDYYYAQFKRFIGQTVSVAVTGYSTIVFEVVGVCHDVDANGKPLFLSFMPKRDCITTHAMNSSNTTAGGWAACAMRAWLASTVLTALPSDLQAAITAAHKVNTTNYGAATDDKLWLASYTEVGLGGSEGTVYERFASASNTDRVRYSGSSAGRWWLRSVRDSSYFRYVYSDGSLSYDSAYFESGVVPCFCI